MHSTNDSDPLHLRRIVDSGPLCFENCSDPLFPPRIVVNESLFWKITDGDPYISAELSIVDPYFVKIVDSGPLFPLRIVVSESLFWKITDGDPLHLRRIVDSGPLFFL